VSGRFLLDTNAVIALFRGDSSLAEKLDDAEEVFVPSIVLGELLYGAYGSARREENASRVRRFAAATPVLVCDSATAEEYGRIKDRLRSKSKPIPENDLWISALALQHGLRAVCGMYEPPGKRFSRFSGF
jgi:tRNA(fMet)-specific endonuclease VapC